MDVLNYILLGLLLLCGLFLIIAVLMQHGKSHGLSGAIAGGAETFFGKEKGTKIDKILGKLTTVVGIIFVVLVLVVYFIQPDFKQDNSNQSAVGATAYDYSYSETINI